MLALDMLRGAADAGAQPTLDLNFTSGTLDSRVTYTGASLATLTDATGAIAYKPHNLLTYSEAFDNAAWSKAAATVTANVGVAPDGTTSADLIVPTAVSAVHYVRQAPALSNSTTYTWSVYAKASGYSIIAIEAYSGTAFNYANVNVTTGAVGTVTGGLVVSTPVLVNGMCRFSVTMTTAATGVPKFTAIICAADATYTFTGDGTSGVYLYGAQLNVGPLQPYYPTTSAAYFGPRFTYDPVTHAALGLLIEEQRTNLATYSQDLSNAVWAKSGSSVSLVAASAPDGGGAYKLVENSATSDHRVSTVATVSIGQAYSTAIYAKQAGRTAIKFYANMQGGTKSFVVDLVTGAVSGSSMPSAPVVSNAGGGYWRIAYTETADITSIIGLYIVLLNGGVESYLGDGASGVYIWGAQLEAGAFATSYIPTTSASVTRAADSATMMGSNFSSWYNSTQGTLVVNAISNSIGTNNEGTATIYQDATNTIGVGRRYAGGGLTTISLFVYTGGATQAYAQSGTISVGAPYKSAARYAANDFAISVNGDAPTTDVAGTPPSSPTSLLIGRTYANEYSSGPIARLRYYPVALTNAQLQALTT